MKNYVKISGFCHYQTRTESGDAFALDTSVPLIFDHAHGGNFALLDDCDRAGHILSMEQRSFGIWLEALVPAEVAEKVNGFSVGTRAIQSKKRHNMGQLLEISVCTGKTKPMNKHCMIREREKVSDYTATRLLGLKALEARHAVTSDLIGVMKRAVKAIATEVRSRPAATRKVPYRKGMTLVQYAEAIRNAR